MKTTVKIKMIVWGWAVSFLFAMAAPATMEAGIDAGSCTQFLMGLALILVFGLLSFAIYNNSKACMVYLDELDQVFIEVLKKL